MINANASVKSSVHAKKIIFRILAHVFVRKRIVDESVITCDEVICYYINKYDKKYISKFDKYYIKVRYKMDCYILHTVLLVIVLLFIIDIICYHYAKHGQNVLKKNY